MQEDSDSVVNREGEGEREQVKHQTPGLASLSQ